MPKYRRAIVPGGTFFFTIVTYARKPIFADPNAIAMLGTVLRESKQRWPMTIDAIVLLPDHLHTIWTLPSGDGEYSKRIGWIKKEFTKRWLKFGGSDTPVSPSKKRERRRGIWQPRFWEHTIQDDRDFDHHFDYIHWNPVKHQHVTCPKDWGPSSFHRWVAYGHYSLEWGCTSNSVDLPPGGVASVTEAGEPAPD